MSLWIRLCNHVCATVVFVLGDARPLSRSLSPFNTDIHEIVLDLLTYSCAMQFLRCCGYPILASDERWSRTGYCACALAV